MIKYCLKVTECQYHLANIVDDHLMETSMLIRGEEWLPSMLARSIVQSFWLGCT
jgi:glutamyl/glutaminyl-tRNA synthetase